MKKIKIAYLPCYIKLYDDSNPATREPLVAYMNTLVQVIESQGIEVVVADEVCRIKEEFDRAAAKFNSDPDIVAVVTQHLAYCPALELIDALKSLTVPIFVLDTTPDYELLSVANYENRIGANHGIHGVQDMCNLLKRNGVAYTIFTGHAMHSEVIAELCGCVRAAAAAKAFKECRVGMAGGEFEGMGDFRIPDERYEKEIGAKTIRLTAKDTAKYLALVTDEEIEAELDYNCKQYDLAFKNRDAYIAEIKTGLAIRKWMDAEKLDGITVNFLHSDESGLPKMPFVECCKTLARGKGYAGEGDNLTAGLVAALISVYPDTTFAEMFCPDWEKDRILLSHMGEMNPRLAAWKPVIRDIAFNYNTCGDTVAMTGCYRAGKAVYVNLAPMATGFSLILSEVELTDEGLPDGAYADSVQGWMKPGKPVAEFLKEYSEAGGTHHSAMIYNAKLGEIAEFGKIMGFETIII